MTRNHDLPTRRLHSDGYKRNSRAGSAAPYYLLKRAGILLLGKQRHRVRARSLLCFWAVKQLGMSSLTVAGRLEITQPAGSRLAQRGEKLAIENGLHLEN